MKRTGSAIYAIVCALLLLGGLIALFCFAWQAGTRATAESLIAFALSFALAPTVHEFGHVAMAKWANMRPVYVKFFCFCLEERKGKLRLGFASPFAAEQTQAMPNAGGNMKKRAIRFTLGGLLFGGVFVLAVAAAAVILLCFGRVSYALWGLLPYSAYMLLLNAVPAQYPSGKTDFAVYLGIKKDEPTERTMLSAMEIFGLLSEDKSFSEIDESLYFNLPCLPEDEPLFAVICDLRYRYYLEKNDFERAADQMNRLAQAQAYLSDTEVEKIAAELLYLHALQGDIDAANECGKLCENYLKSEDATAKRILAAYCLSAGKQEAVQPLIAQARELLENERTAGVKRLEETLLARLA